LANTLDPLWERVRVTYFGDVICARIVLATKEGDRFTSLSKFLSEIVWLTHCRCLNENLDEIPQNLSFGHSTATTATSGSLFVPLCKNLESAPKHPDLLVRYRGSSSTDVGVAEVSLEPCAQKDTGDLCRVALWSKRILDELVTKMEITEGIQVLFFQVIGKNCTFYAMKRSGTVCVAVEISKIKIVYTLTDVLVWFEEDVRGWLVVDRTFQNLVSTLQSAVPRKSGSPPPPVFAGLSTPRSRRMSRDTHRPL
jgi:hypothetical protein